jgi:sulfite exporter TauE/SafE
MSATALFVTGLTTGAVAGGASCAAVQGGLLAGAVGRRRAHVAGRRSTQVPPVPDEAPTGAGARLPVALRDPPVSRDDLRDGESAILALGAFLGAKLVSHTLLGALLGSIGSAAQPSPRTRAMLLIAAAAIMVVFALDLIGVRGVRRLVPRAPESWARRVRKSSRSSSASTPAILGFLTVLLPCGVTLSVSLLAITSESAVSGGAVMAGFVLGTAPLFAALGFVLRQSTRVLQGRLSVLTGVVVLAVAVWTANSALKLGGWADVGHAEVTPTAASAVRVLSNGTQVVTLQVGATSYTPAAVVARPGVPTQIVLKTRGINGCTSAFVIASRGIEKVLPETGTTTLDLGKPKPGTLKYTCGMGMYGGRIEFRQASTTGGPA